jgi:hypothetical protein
MVQINKVIKVGDHQTGERTILSVYISLKHRVEQGCNEDTVLSWDVARCLVAISVDFPTHTSLYTPLPYQSMTKESACV